MKAVHGGASLSPSTSSVDVCLEAVKQKSIIDIISVLESSPKFNCGYGSNLNFNGEVECEAGYMTTDSLRFGAVGALSGVKCPSKVAYTLAHDDGIPLLVPPLCIVGEGAFEYAKKKGYATLDPTNLVTRHSLKVWQKAKDAISKHNPESVLLNPGRLDTVGAVCIQESIAEACTSSGGIVMKHPGRLGHCTIFGAGTWVDHDPSTGILISASVSGCGEALVRTDFCRSLVRTMKCRDEDSEMPSDSVRRWFQNDFLDAPILQSMNMSRRLAGGIVIIKDGRHFEFIVFHNTPFLPIAYQCGSKKPIAYLSQLNEDSFNMASTSMKPNRRFAIPNSDDDLIINSVYYKVENGEMEESEIMSAFAEMDRRLEEDPNDVFCLYDNFDAFFSLLKFNSKCEQWTLRLNAGQLILEVLNRLSASQYGEVARAVYDVLHSDGRPSPEIFKRCDDTADVLLMAIYLLQKLTNHWESEFQRREKSIAKKGRRQVERDDDMNAWLSLRSKMLSMFTRLCDLSSSDREGKIRKAALRYLWRPPEVDKDLLKALVEVSFKFFDNPDTVRATSRQWLIEIFKMLRVICINFDFFSRLGGILVEKTIHLDYLKEATVTTYPFIDAIIGAAHSSKDGDSDMDPLLSYMIQYIGSLGEIDFSAFSPKQGAAKALIQEGSCIRWRNV